VSDRGESGFQPHPGDPWHPGWSDSDETPAVPEDTTPSDEAKEPKKRRRGLFRRRRRDEEDGGDDFDDTSADAPGDQSIDIPEGPPEYPVPDEPDDAPTPAIPSDGPQPAWLSDSESGGETTLTVDLPSWASDTTAGAEGVAGGFVEPSIDDEDEPTEEHDGVPDVEAAALDVEMRLDPAETDQDEPVVDAAEPEQVDEVDRVEAAEADQVDEDEPVVEVAEEDQLDEDEPVVEVADPEQVAEVAGAEAAEADQVDEDGGVAGVAEPEQVDDAGPVEQVAEVDESSGADEADRELDEAAMTVAPDDLAAVLDALGSEDDDEVEVIEAAVVEEDTEPVDLEALSALAEGAGDPTPEEAAARSQYGVAGPEAFHALRELDDAADDLEEWEEFAATSPSKDVPGAVDEPEVDEVVPEEPEETPRRRMWPFRRRAEPEIADDEVVEEVSEWEDDGSAIPRQWFADIDEDTVVAPPADLPETDWPVADDDRDDHEVARDVTAEPSLFDQAPGVELATDASAADELLDEMPAAGLEAPLEGDGAVPEPEAYGDRPVDGEETEETEVVPDADLPPAAWESEGPRADDIAESPAEATPIPDWSEPAAEGDDLLPDRLELGFDDGTGESDPIRRSAFEEGEDADDDDWVTGPIDVSDDEETEEQPDEYETLEHLSDAIFQTSATEEHRGLAEEIFRAGEEEREWQAISAAMPGVETGVVGFDDVADLGTDEEHYEPRAPSDMGTRVLTGVVLAGFFLGSLWVAPEALAGFIGIILLLGLGELYATVRRVGYRPLPLFGFLGGIAMLATAWFHGPVAIPATLAITMVVTFFVYALSAMRGDALTNGGLTLLGLGWVVGTAAFAYPILASEDYRILVLALVGVTAAMDIGAYGVGGPGVPGRSLRWCHPTSRWRGSSGASPHACSPPPRSGASWSRSTSCRASASEWWWRSRRHSATSPSRCSSEASV